MMTGVLIIILSGLLGFVARRLSNLSTAFNELSKELAEHKIRATLQECALREGTTLTEQLLKLQRQVKADD